MMKTVVQNDIGAWSKNEIKSKVFWNRISVFVPEMEPILFILEPIPPFETFDCVLQ